MGKPVEEYYTFTDLKSVKMGGGKGKGREGSSAIWYGDTKINSSNHAMLGNSDFIPWAIKKPWERLEKSK